MSSALTPIAASPAASSTTTQRSPQHPGHRKVFLVVITFFCVAACAAAIAVHRWWPFTENAVVQDLAEASDSEVTIRSARRTYFPSPGCILEGVEFRHGRERWKLITIEKLTVEGSYAGILTRHVPRIKAEGGHVYVPPLGSGVTFSTQHSTIVVDKLVADGALVDFASRDPGKAPLRFEVHKAVLHDVRWGSPFEYQLKLRNPQPPGELTTNGKFGAWTTGTPGETPISGEFVFEQADLGVYGGIGGILSSKGKYGGHLKHIDISGSTNVPDFVVKSGGHKVKLVTQFDAYVDAIR